MHRHICLGLPFVLLLAVLANPVFAVESRDGKRFDQGYAMTKPAEAVPELGTMAFYMGQ